MTATHTTTQYGYKSVTDGFICWPSIVSRPEFKSLETARDAVKKLNETSSHCVLVSRTSETIYGPTIEHTPPLPLPPTTPGSVVEDTYGQLWVLIKTRPNNVWVTPSFDNDMKTRTPEQLRGATVKFDAAATTT